MPIKLPEKSICYDDYWHFAHIRHSRFLNTLNGAPSICDPIVDSYKFTNCYRALDRTSQYLIKNITNKTEHSKEDTLLRILLFKVFNKIETWQALERKFDNISIDTFSISEYSQELENLRLNGQKIYSAAYIMPSGSREFGSKTKHLNNLRMIQEILKSNLAEQIWATDNLAKIYELFLSVPSLGRFLAFQYAIDVAYSPYSLAEEKQFVVAGPGAIRGIKKCFPDASPDQYEKIIKYMADAQEDEFSRLNLNFKTIGSRKLQLIDCQNLFCETDKYLRVKRPEFDKRGARIKQKYKISAEKIEFELPTKWNTTF